MTRPLASGMRSSVGLVVNIVAVSIGDRCSRNARYGWKGAAALLLLPLLHIYYCKPHMRVQLSLASLDLMIRAALGEAFSRDVVEHSVSRP